MEKAQNCGWKFRKNALEFGYTYAPDPFGRLHDSYSLLFRIADFIIQKFKGEPRVFSSNPSYCADISTSAKILYHFNTAVEWPDTFRTVLADKLSKCSEKDVQLQLLKPLQLPPTPP